MTHPGKIEAVVCDLTSKRSLKGAFFWATQLRKECPDIVLGVVGNKSDLVDDILDLDGNDVVRVRHRPEGGVHEGLVQVQHEAQLALVLGRLPAYLKDGLANDTEKTDADI